MIIKLLTLVLLFSTSFAAGAATLRVESGSVVGVDNLVVGTTTYSVSFVYGSYNTVFPDQGLVPTFSGDSTGADAAAKAIMDAVSTDGNYVNSPTSFEGCWNTNYCWISTPYDPGSSSTSGAYMKILPSGPLSVSTINYGNSYNYDDITHAVFSEVPVTAAAWLFLSALGGLGIIKRKRS